MASHGEQIIPLTQSTDTIKKCELKNDIGVGDCVQVAGSFVSLKFDPDFDPNVASARWSARTFSSHPQPAFHDSWHQSFTFLTNDGQIAAFMDVWKDMT